MLLDLDDNLCPGPNQTEDHFVTSPLEDQNEAAIGEDTFVLELDLGAHDDTEENSQTLTFDDETRRLQDNPSQIKERRSLKRSFEEQEDLLILDPVDISQTKTQSSRKRLKRKLLIDEVISIDRQVIFNNLSNPSYLLKPPVFAASTKREMKQYERNQSLLSKGSLRELAPALEKLFLHPKSRKFSTSADVSGESVERELSQTGFGNNEDLFNHKPDVLDFSEQFIPLQDVEYSSDEESPVGSPVGSRFEDSTLTEFDFEDDTMEEQTEETLADENISEDKFCSLVETTVLQSRPEALTFRQVVGSDDGKLTRKTVARRFLKCLLMQRDARLSLEQEESFEQILLHPGLKHVSEEAVGEM